MLLPTTCLHSQYQTTLEMLSFTAPVYLTRFSVCLFMCLMSTVPPREGTSPVPSSPLMQLWVASCTDYTEMSVGKCPEGNTEGPGTASSEPLLPS